MAYGIKLHVQGDWALFSRPEMKAERVSYDVITPSAARGILEAIYWKPEMRWRVKRIHVLNPVSFTNIRRNEVGNIAASPSEDAMKGEPSFLGLFVDEGKNRQQRASMLLTNVAYIIEAEIQVVNTGRGDTNTSSHPEAKHLDTFKRRARGGKCFHRPYFGCREFAADFSLIEEADSLPPTKLQPAEMNWDFGFMLHDIIYRPDTKGMIIEKNQGTRLTAEPRFFRAVMKEGIIDVPSLEQSFA